MTKNVFSADELNNQASTSLPVNHDSNSSSRESRNRISVECRPIPKSPPPPYFTPPFTGCNSTVQISTETGDETAVLLSLVNYNYLLLLELCLIVYKI